MIRNKNDIERSNKLIESLNNWSKKTNNKFVHFPFLDSIKYKINFIRINKNFIYFFGIIAMLSV